MYTANQARASATKLYLAGIVVCGALVLGLLFASAAQAQTTTASTINWGTYDQSTGLYYNSLTKLYYNPQTGLYFDPVWNKYYTEDGVVTSSGSSKAPGVPNTGMGGEAARNLSVLLGSGLVAVAGASYLLSQRKKAVR